MAEVKRVTKRDYFEMLRGLAEAAGETGAVEFCDKEMERLANRKAGQTKVQKANEGLVEEVYAAIVRAGEPVTITDLLGDAELKAAVEATGANFSSQKVSALAKKLNDAQRVVKTTKKKKSYFSAKADVDEDID